MYKYPEPKHRPLTQEEWMHNNGVSFRDMWSDRDGWQQYDSYLRSRVVKLPTDLPSGPCGAEIVRLPSVDAYEWGKPMLKGSLDGMIDGRVGHPIKGASVCFNFRAFVGRDHEYEGNTHAEYCSCSGGPATIWTPARILKPTGEIAVVRCWKWRNGPEAHGGIEYYRECRVWTVDSLDVPPDEGDDLA